MLRTLGIPAREAVGYVPGPYDPITDLYDIQASDAHAWVQVWFPYYGWQSFDPTAVVPLANPSPAHVLLHDVAAILAKAPWVPVGVPLVVLFAAGYRGPRLADAGRQTWAEQVARRLGRLGARARSPRRPGETLTEFAARLDTVARRSVRDLDCGRQGGRGRGLRPARAGARGTRSTGRHAQGFTSLALRVQVAGRAFRSSRGTEPLARRRTTRQGSTPRVLTPTAGRDPDRTSHLR